MCPLPSGLPGERSWEGEALGPGAPARRRRVDAGAEDQVGRSSFSSERSGPGGPGVMDGLCSFGPHARGGE